MRQAKLKTATRLNPTTLIEDARKAAHASYSKYSGFPVGAAVLAGGKIYLGTNIENASYGLTMCAERVAIFAAISAGNKTIERIAITCIKAAPGRPELRFPCGACRQVMAEFASSNTVVEIDGWGETTLGDLLPFPFKISQ
jgi:cytidine deaminase